MSERNTPEAPRLQHCDTCGASTIDGPITVLHGIRLCADCRQGALDLVADDPATWQFGPDGRLHRTTPDPRTERARAQVTALHDTVAARLRGIDGVAAGVTVEVFHPQSGIAIILPNGCRWHLYIPHSGLLRTEHYHAVLFTPAREIVPGFPVADLADLRAVRHLVTITATITVTPGNDLSQAIDDDVLRRAEITLFDADVLLPPEHH